MEVLAVGNEYEDLRQIKLECFSYAKEHFQGQVFYNVSRGVQIRVSRTGLNEWFAKTKSYEQAQSIKFLGEILRCAEYSHSAANNHPKKGDEHSTFDYYRYPFEWDGKKFCVVLTIKNIAGQGGIYYHHYLAKNQAALKHDSARFGY